MHIAFGDKVRIYTTLATEAAGVAGLVGQVYGETTPSMTAVEVIGQADDDYAINVFFQDRNQSFWFAAGLLEFVDHGPGTTIGIDGCATKWMKTEHGEWIEMPPQVSKVRLLSKLWRWMKAMGGRG